MAKSSFFSSSKSKRNAGIAASVIAGIGAIATTIFATKKVKEAKGKKG